MQGSDAPEPAMLRPLLQGGGGGGGGRAWGAADDAMTP